MKKELFKCCVSIGILSCIGLNLDGGNLKIGNRILKIFKTTKSNDFCERNELRIEYACATKTTGF